VERDPLLGVVCCQVQGEDGVAAARLRVQLCRRRTEDERRCVFGGCVWVFVYLSVIWCGCGLR
jgi:hypothetical protein